jgi:hypothetical protein
VHYVCTTPNNDDDRAPQHSRTLIALMEAVFRRDEAAIEPPELVARGLGLEFRYRENSLKQAIVQKGGALADRCDDAPAVAGARRLSLVTLTRCRALCSRVYGI